MADPRPFRDEMSDRFDSMATIREGRPLPLNPNGHDADRPGPIHELLGALDGAQDALTHRINALARALEPIMAARPDTVLTDEPAYVGSSGIARSLHIAIARTAGNAEQVDAITRALEL